jgi:hypothetical protein
MKQETTKAFEIIRHFSDRAVQRGNIFMSTIEVINFVNAFNHVTAICLEHEQMKARGENGLVTEKEETIK